MTTMVDLICLAANPRHASNPAIQSICTAISEAVGQQRNWLALLTMSTNIVRDSMERNVYYIASDDSMVKYATEHALACAKANTLFMTLACALQGLGEPIEY